MPERAICPEHCPDTAPFSTRRPSAALSNCCNGAPPSATGDTVNLNGAATSSVTDSAPIGPESRASGATARVGAQPAAPLAPLTPLGVASRRVLRGRINAAYKTLLASAGRRPTLRAEEPGTVVLRVEGARVLDVDDLRRLVVDNRALADRVRQLEQAVKAHEAADAIDTVRGAMVRLAVRHAGTPPGCACVPVTEELLAAMREPLPHAASPARIGGSAT